MAAVKRQLQGYINTLKCPGKGACLSAKKKEVALSSRDWRAIKYFVHNQIEKKKKK